MRASFTYFALWYSLQSNLPPMNRWHEPVPKKKSFSGEDPLDDGLVVITVALASNDNDAIAVT